MSTHWQKQDYDSPLFEDLIWSKPVQKSHAGTVLIIGGNAHAIAAPSTAFAQVTNQGIGNTFVYLPDATRKLLGPKPPNEIHLTASTPSGSFSKQAFPELLQACVSVDTVLFAGDFGRNSETAILLDDLSSASAVPHIYTGDSIDYFAENFQTLTQRDNTLLVCSLAQLQKIATGIQSDFAITHAMGLAQITAALHKLTHKNLSAIVTMHQNTVLCAHNGSVITTNLPNIPDNWSIIFAASCAVWWAQNPSTPLQAYATAITQV